MKVLLLLVYCLWDSHLQTSCLRVCCGGDLSPSSSSHLPMSRLWLLSDGGAIMSCQVTLLPLSLPAWLSTVPEEKDQCDKEDRVGRFLTPCLTNFCTQPVSESGVTPSRPMAWERCKKVAICLLPEARKYGFSGVWATSCALVYVCPLSCLLWGLQHLPGSSLSLVLAQMLVSLQDVVSRAEINRSWVPSCSRWKILFCHPLGNVLGLLILHPKYLYNLSGFLGSKNNRKRSVCSEVWIVDNIDLERKVLLVWIFSFCFRLS